MGSYSTLLLHFHPRIYAPKLHFVNKGTRLYSALASANVDPVAAAVGIPDESAHAVPPLVASVQPETIASFPLRFRHAEAYICNRTALIGDAAHVIHPLAGQGRNLGLRDAAALTRYIRNAVMHGGDTNIELPLSKVWELTQTSMAQAHAP
jgi:2-polyprenyl-6-methoxyphenol hydroxylase-like FAD-dependent oxidoreductase